MSLKDLVTKVRLQFILGLIATTIVAQFNDAKAYALGLKEALVAGDIAFTHASFNGGEKTDVGSALAELASAQSGQEITFEKLTNANSGKLASYRFTKGTGSNAVTMDIDIPKDYVNNIIGIVAEDGNGQAGTFLKVNVAPTGDTAEYQYVDVSGLIEYLTVGDQTGKIVTLSINANHQITADIADKAITKAKLEQSVQDSLDAAYNALQEDDFDQISEADCTSAWTTAMTNAQSAWDAAHSQSGGE